VDSGRTSEASAIGSWTSRLGFSLDVQLIPAPASDEPASEHAILDVVFHSLPIPTEDVSLEELLLFKRDENHRLRRLVIWLLRQIRKEVDADLLRLEIEEMIASYSAEMQVHRITHEIGTLRTLVSVPLEVVQALIRLKPKDALDALYSVRLHKAALTAAEAKAPGKEVAYVAVARERYSSYPV
jgi:hypothetical protein